MNKLNSKRIFKVLFVIISIYLVLMFVHKYPVYYASTQTPEGYSFSGQASWFDPWDVNVYVSAIKSGQQNGILLPNLYTTEKDSPTFIYPFYTLIGSLFKHYDGFLLFHALSFITSLLVCLGVFIAAYFILDSFYYSLIAIVLVILGRGVGWLHMFEVSSADVTVTSFTFRSAIQRPHEGIGTILYLFAMVFFIKFIETDKRIYNSIALWSLLLLVFFYPYYLPVYSCVFAFCLVFFKADHGKSAWTALIRNTVIIGSITLAYFFYLRNSSFSAAIAEDLPKISFYSLLLGYGFYFLAYLWSFLKIGCRDLYKGFLVAWVTVCIIASYLPLGFSRFYLRGLFFPLALLVIIVIRDLFQYKKGKHILVVISFMFLAFAMPTSLFVFNQRVRAVDAGNPWYYLPVGYRKAFDYIAGLPGNGILAHPVIMNYVPAYTGKKVYIGHLLQTPSYLQKEAELKNVYSGRITRERVYDFFLKNNISYVIYGPAEQGEVLFTPDFLKQIFHADGVAVYSVD